MPHPTKKQKLEGHPSEVATAENDCFTSFDDLSIDVLANIFKYLPLEEIMGSRCHNKKSADAVKMTIVPLGDFRVNNIIKYNAMGVMTEAMPNLQQITLDSLGYNHKYNDGEDPDERRSTGTADDTTHDIDIISNFSKLKILDIIDSPLRPSLNGRYPFLFNSFPLLQKLSIKYGYCLKWDLEMLDGLPSLKELDFYENSGTTGNINSLRAIKDTLEKVRISRCRHVEGNFMDLADFPQLKKLDLEETAVTGDIRDIDENDYSSLEELLLPMGVYGGKGYKLQRISDAPELMRAVYLFNKKHQGISKLKLKDWCGELSQDSPDWYESMDEIDTTPFCIRFVQAGSRVGYLWEASFDGGHPCEVNWLDPEPDKESSDYGKYIEELQKIERDVNRSSYRGFHQPPTEEEYIRLHDV
jgi:hypothetical protein